jgi:hypothetical protein
MYRSYENILPISDLADDTTLIFHIYGPLMEVDSKAYSEERS